MPNPYDGTAAVVVPSVVERLPLFRWRPGIRLLSIGSRGGTCFDGDLDREEATTYRRSIDAGLVRAARERTGCAGFAATWSESLRFERGLAILLHEAEDLPVVVTTAGHGPEPSLERLARIDAWCVLVSGTPGPAVTAILAGARHVEVVLGLDEREQIPDLDWSRVAAVHLVAIRAAADPTSRRGWYATARGRLPAIAVHDEDTPHSDCVCGARLLWRSGAMIRRDTLADDGSCTACGTVSGIRIR